MPRTFLKQIVKPFCSIILLSGMLTGCASLDTKPSARSISASAEQQVNHSYCYKFLYGNYAAQPNYQRALHWCKQGALAGIAQTQTLLAEMYFLGFALDKDLKQALHWYHAAAKQGQAHAQFMLHHFYSRGLGTPANQSIALDWLNKAAIQGHPQANNVLTQEAESSTDT
ncbi:MAG: TPR repeat protein [Glaciecola sp.]|jgi:TPR repeat protein